ncbi:MAG: bifunctional 2-polyprenyl-6-hydroxyphenol methylase/3-demethylubiquinol 3-O-methyltransferase UbiG, partial [Pseudomonadota bacterium]
MGNANTTIRPEEAAFFSELARDWWNPKGKMASLHEVNPVRLEFLRDAIDAHWPGSAATAKPLEGKSVLDIGCGAGLLCEPMARLGGAVTGVDASAENVSVAATHAEAVGLDIRYMAGEVASLDIGTFDLVTSVEVIEHVADKRAFIADVAARLAPGGLLVMST